MSNALARRSLPEVLRAALEAHTEGMHVALPGRVVSYSAASQTAVVEAGVKLPLRGEFGEVVYESLPTFPDVPIAWPKGGGYYLTFPLAPGDPVLLVFSDVAAGEYLNTGEISEPADTRRHSLGYPVAIPGGASPDTKALTDASADALTLGKDGNPAQVKVKAGAIELGKDAASFVALATLVDAHLETLRAAVNSVGAVIPPLATVAATLVKAK